MNTILMEIYDEYEKNKTISKLEEFTNLTFPSDGTDKVFIGCVLILITSVYRTRVNAESLYTVVLSAKETVYDSNLLKFYLDRVNDNKLVSKYLSKVINNKNFNEYIDVILSYLKDMSFDFSEIIKSKYKVKLNEYKNKSQYK